MLSRRVNAALFLAFALFALDGPGAEPPALTLGSSAFEPNGSIPPKFTCEGKDASPPLAWSGAPAGTKSFALIVDDPDAPAGTWVHWVIFNIPAGTERLAGVMKTDHLPPGAQEGRNSWGTAAYRGPCPPSGRHRYFFKLFALDALLTNLKDPDAATLDKAMQDHVLAKAELVGTYQKTKR